MYVRSLGTGYLGSLTQALDRLQVYLGLWSHQRPNWEDVHFHPVSVVNRVHLFVAVQLRSSFFDDYWLRTVPCHMTLCMGPLT